MRYVTSVRYTNDASVNSSFSIPAVLEQTAIGATREQLSKSHYSQTVCRSENAGGDRGLRESSGFGNER
jgi:hypothetical protein